MVLVDGSVHKGHWTSLQFFTGTIMRDERLFCNWTSVTFYGFSILPCSLLYRFTSLHFASLDWGNWVFLSHFCRISVYKFEVLWIFWNFPWTALNTSLRIFEELFLIVEFVKKIFKYFHVLLMESLDTFKTFRSWGWSLRDKCLNCNLFEEQETLWKYGFHDFEISAFSFKVFLYVQALNRRRKIEETCTFGLFSKSGRRNRMS